MQINTISFKELFEIFTTIIMYSYLSKLLNYAKLVITITLIN